LLLLLLLLVVVVVVVVLLVVVVLVPLAVELMLRSTLTHNSSLVHHSI
jgi:hypothetical protein